MTDLAEALSLHRSGRLAEAEKAYQAILSHEPAQIDATHLLGILSRQSGRPEAAVSLIGRAIALNGEVPEFHYNLATALNDLGQLKAAAAAFRRALALRPQYVEAALGLGNALARLNEDAAAAEAYRIVLSLEPDRADAASNLGVVLRRLGRIEEAVASYRRAVALSPASADTHYNLGNALVELGRTAEAIESFHAAIALRPSHPESHYNLANAYSSSEDVVAAEASYRRAIELRPTYPEAHNNFGKLLQSMGRYEEALRAFNSAVESAPEHGDIRYNRALLLLLTGHRREGWAEHEWRWRSNTFPSPRRIFPQPLWDGRESHRSTLLVYAEQGFGDTFQFARYVVAARARVGRVVFEVPRELMRSLRGLAGVDQLVAAGDSLPSFDLQTPLLTLVHRLGEDAASRQPYLSAEPELARSWRVRLRDNDRLKVGIVWAGNPKHGNDRNRSLPAIELSSLLREEVADFFSLQLGARYNDLAPADRRVVDLASNLADFADTAAILCALDLLITVDTSVAHLAGALGRPAWVLLPFAPDWRWEIGDSTTRWYPSMQLFRQPEPGSWSPVIREIVRSLREQRSA